MWSLFMNILAALIWIGGMIFIYAYFLGKNFIKYGLPFTAIWIVANYIFKANLSIDLLVYVFIGIFVVVSVVYIYNAVTFTSNNSIKKKATELDEDILRHIIEESDVSNE